MYKVTIVQLGVIVSIVCLSTQVVSQNNTMTSPTSNPNNTTMASVTYNSSTNSSTPTGAGVLLHADIFSFLVPIVMAASLLQCYC